MQRIACNLQEVGNISNRLKKPQPTFINVGVFAWQLTMFDRMRKEVTDLPKIVSDSKLLETTVPPTADAEVRCRKK